MNTNLNKKIILITGCALLILRPVLAASTTLNNATANTSIWSAVFDKLHYYYQQAAPYIPYAKYAKEQADFGGVLVDGAQTAGIGAKKTAACQLAKQADTWSEKVAEDELNKIQEDCDKLDTASVRKAAEVGEGELHWSINAFMKPYVDSKLDAADQLQDASFKDPRSNEKQVNDVFNSVLKSGKSTHSPEFDNYFIGRATELQKSIDPESGLLQMQLTQVKSSLQSDLDNKAVAPPANDTSNMSSSPEANPATPGAPATTAVTTSGSSAANAATGDPSSQSATTSGAGSPMQSGTGSESAQSATTIGTASPTQTATSGSDSSQSAATSAGSPTQAATSGTNSPQSAATNGTDTPPQTAASGANSAPTEAGSPTQAAAQESGVSKNTQTQTSTAADSGPPGSTDPSEKGANQPQSEETAATNEPKSSESTDKSVDTSAQGDGKSTEVGVSTTPQQTDPQASNPQTTTETNPGSGSDPTTANSLQMPSMQMTDAQAAAQDAADDAAMDGTANGMDARYSKFDASTDTSKLQSAISVSAQSSDAMQDMADQTVSQDGVIMQQGVVNGLNAMVQIQQQYARAREQAANAGRPRAWVCNFMHTQHNDPSECEHPEQGGTWVYLSN